MSSRSWGKEQRSQLFCQKDSEINMVKRKPQVLIVEDDVDLLEFYQMQLQADDYVLHGADTPERAQAKLEETDFDVVLTDLKFPQAKRGGFDLLKHVKRKNPDNQVIIFTGFSATDEARLARLNADGYLTKPLNLDTVQQVIRKAIETKAQQLEWRKEVRKRRTSRLRTPELFVAGSQIMRELEEQAIGLASQDMNLLLLGEPGTGKGLLAEGIHAESGRQLFELVNCSSLSEPALERIIFGVYDDDTAEYNPGLLERLVHGTLVLDQVARLSAQLQQKLVSALVTGEYHVHEHLEPVRVNVRIIALADLGRDGRIGYGLFISELYDVFAQSDAILWIPPLRERRDDDRDYHDAFELAKRFIEKHLAQDSETEGLSMGIDPDIKRIFKHYPFPGNVRELELAISDALRQQTNGIILPRHLPQRMRRYDIQQTLGIHADERTQKPVMCPHEGRLCDQTAVIADGYQQVAGVYVRLSHHVEADTIQAITHHMDAKGLTAVFPKQLDHPLTALCDVCVPIQACHYAIVDVTESTQQVFYELGLLHALGVPVLMMLRDGYDLPVGFTADVVAAYDDSDDARMIVEQWTHSVQKLI